VIRDIVQYPNPILTTPTNSIELFNGVLALLIEDMLDTMYFGRGIGLAAPQISVQLSVLVYDMNSTHKKKKKRTPQILVNPLIERSEGIQIDNESCLSFPGMSRKVKRFKKIWVSYQDAEGKEKKLYAENYEARVIQHEMDHLVGEVFINKKF